MLKLIFYFEQAHSNIGYIATLCLNLSILLPLANNPKVNNYVIVLYVRLQPGCYLPISDLTYIELMHIGSSLVSGGVGNFRK